jgi:O-antigen/teichoic acid export membrane protein
MGIEAYGLVGISITLQAIFSSLDLGLTTALGRQLAFLSGKQDKAEDMRNFLRTLESIYWTIGLVISLIVIALAPFIASRWLQESQYSLETLSKVLMIIGIGIFFSWPCNFYNAGMSGLQRILILNVIKAGMGILRSGGVLIVLWIISPTVEVFFCYNAVIAALQTFLTAGFLWHYMPVTGERACFKFEILKASWRFLAGISGIIVTGTIIGEMDKIILSKLLTLEMFGYYTLAMAVASYIHQTAASIYAPLFPRLTQLVGLEDMEALKGFYHKSCQFVSLIVFPVAVIVAVFSKDIMTLWLREPKIVQHIYVVVSVLVAYKAIMSMTTMPYCLQVAHAWTKLAFFSSLVLVMIQAPMMFLMVHLYGIVGAAVTLMICGSGYLISNIQLTHRRLLPGEGRIWYIKDVGGPLIGAVGCGILGRWIYNAQASPVIALATLCAIFIMMFISSALMAPEMRKRIIPHLKYGLYLR